MTTSTTYTPEEYAAKFPRARGHDRALRYVVVEHHPKDGRWAWFRTIPIALTESVAKVGYTNKSRSKTITRFAIIPAEGDDQ